MTAVRAENWLVVVRQYPHERERWQYWAPLMSDTFVI